MYNVRNTSGKDIALQLEKGGIVIRPNKHLDLDQFCSRKWISSNFELRKLINGGYLQLVHDSRAVLPKPPIKPIQRIAPVAPTPSKVVSNKPVEIIDLVNFPDVEINDSGHVSKPKEAKEEQPAPPVVVAPPVVEPPPAPVPEPTLPELPVPEEVAPVVEEIKEPEPPAEVEEPEEKEEEKTEEEKVFGGFDFNKPKKKKKMDFRKR